jgi:Protein of unknown function (DUF3089)
MRGHARVRSASGRATAVVAALAALAALTSGCGPRDVTADPTTPAPPAPGPGPGTTAPAPAPPVTTRRPVARYGAFDSRMYGRGENWLCGPEAASSDRCLIGNQDTTVIGADGRAQVRSSDPAPDPRFDCFYAYPALPLTGTNSEALAHDTTAEETVIYLEAARLREQCRMYVPISQGASGMAYGDVLEAFRYYMARWNGGRRVLLFGHAEGADHLARLLQEEFDGDPEMRALLVSAFLIGGHADTAAGSRTGGTFHNIETCAAPTQTGCVVAWATTSPSTPRDVAARWGEAPAGRTRVCVNPAAPAGGPGALTPIVPPVNRYLRSPIDVGTPFIELPGALTAECVTNGAVTTLVVRPASTDPAVESRDGDELLVNQPGWGLHILELLLTMGSVMDLIGQQASTIP